MVLQRKLEQGIMSFDSKLLSYVHPVILHRTDTDKELLCDPLAGLVLGYHSEDRQLERASAVAEWPWNPECGAAGAASLDQKMQRRPGQNSTVPR